MSCVVDVVLILGALCKSKVHETRSHAHGSGNEGVSTRKQKAEAKTTEGESEQSPKKAKTENEEKAENENGEENGKSTDEIKAEFEKFCKATSEHLSIQQMREILEANGQNASGADDAVVPRWLVIIADLILSFLKHQMVYYFY